MVIQWIEPPKWDKNEKNCAEPRLMESVKKFPSFRGSFDFEIRREIRWQRIPELFLKILQPPCCSLDFMVARKFCWGYTFFSHP